MIYKEAATMVCNHFNEEYFDLHQHLLATGEQIGSRNGSTREILNFKTVIKEPMKRCIGGYNRNINVFFLLAEALWIWAGKRDVEFLDTFNSQLKNYSDDGVNYHAPYGWRMRNYGVDSGIVAREENKHALQGIDQIQIALRMLADNPEERRVNILIWDVEKDLAVKSLDIDCNNLIGFNIRNGLLYTTISNRSNDLNLGLTTNVFQFSFVSEIMAKILGIGLGDQVHNSRSLHLYLNHNLTGELNETLMQSPNQALLYEKAQACSMDFSFVDEMNESEKLRMIDFHINSIIKLLSDESKSIKYTYALAYEESLKQFSRYFYFVYKLLLIYTKYKKHHQKDEALNDLVLLGTEMPEFNKSDYYILALNFFAQRILKSKFTDQEQVSVNDIIKQEMYSSVSQY